MFRAYTASALKGVLFMHLRSRKINYCRVCMGRNLVKVMDFGKQPLANLFLKNPSKKETRYSLDVYLCGDCSHLQLGTLVDRKGIFSNYIYFSSPNPKLSEYFKSYADGVKDRVKDWDKGLVVELGSNDGILLKEFVSSNNSVLGIDPAKNIKSCVPTWRKFFGSEVAGEILNKKMKKALIVMANNVLAHTFDMRDMVKGIKDVLDDNGLAVVEAPWLGDMFQNNAYDTIYHEHLSYFSINSLNKLFMQCGLVLTDLEFHPIQGNSFRAFFRKKKRGVKLSPLAKEIINQERKNGWGKAETYAELMDKINMSKNTLLNKLRVLKAQKKKIVGYGAPAKANTIINFTKSGKYIDSLIDGMPSKIGLYAPGSKLKVLPRNQVNPDVFIMFAWNYKKQILEKEEGFKGEWVIPNEIYAT